MKFYCFLAITANVLVSQAQQLVQKNYIPGCMPIRGDYLYMSKGEVSNLQYKEFLFWLKQNKPDSIVAKMKPDTLVWTKPDNYNEPFVQYYFQHTAYSDYPVVGITQSQAMAFCHWAKGRILENFKLKNIPIQDIVVRLPTKEEWEWAARGGQEKYAVYPWPGESIRFNDEKGVPKRLIGRMRMNVGNSKHHGFSTLSTVDAGFLTTPVYSYWPNGYGLYNLSGNVAEWVSEVGKTKGGSYTTTAWHAQINSPGKYDGDTSARSDVGFRYVVELVSVKSNAPKPIKVNDKWVKRNFSKTDSNLFAGKYEVTNALYQQFVHETGPTLAPADSLWLKHTGYQYSLMYSSHAAFAEYPAVNITHEQATQFCQWLTRKYNEQKDKKYKKVNFKLPTAEEWTMAARGSYLNPSYPWGGPYVRNSRGAYLANFYPLPESAFVYDSEHNVNVLPHDTSESMKADGYEFAAPVKSYFPNGYELYCMAGNVAEMTALPDLCKGGSWNSKSIFLQINAYEKIREKYILPSPMVGFRIFMEVQEK
jgi:formylglycine-generating enzyme required for sulfatase activity